MAGLSKSKILIKFLTVLGLLSVLGMIYFVFTSSWQQAIVAGVFALLMHYYADQIRRVQERRGIERERKQEIRIRPI